MSERLGGLSSRSFIHSRSCSAHRVAFRITASGSMNIGCTTDAETQNNMWGARTLHSGLKEYVFKRINVILSSILLFSVPNFANLT